ncbi:MAG: hypothetical protein IJ744_11795 [Lachnospiraceae bacterium]|nr:hypothetical protein [Lachnospiraceae bacterium]
MSKTKKRYYAFLFMIAAEAIAILLTCTGFILRRTVAKGAEQYETVSDIALPLVLIRDRVAAKEEKEPQETTTKETEESTTKETTTEEATTDETTTDESGETTTEGTDESTTEETPAAIDESYFDETLFIGDARVDDLANNARLGTADYFCGENFSIFNIFSKKVTNDDFRNATLDQVLASKSYTQIYLMVGFNDTEYPLSSVMKQYTYALERIMELQPQARIILGAVIHANEETSRSVEGYAVKDLNTMNAEIKELAQQYDGVYFIDWNDLFCDENGYLRSAVSSDGVHLTASAAKEWAEEIVKQAIVE